MIEQFILQDKDNQTIGYILNDELVQAVRDEQLNGAHTFAFELYNKHKYIESIVRHNRILFKDATRNKWYEFIIMSIEKDDLTTKATCESSIYDTISCFVELVEFNGNIITTGLKKILDAAEPKSAWQVGTSDIQGYYSLQATKTNLKSLIWQYLDNVSGHIEERIEVTGGQIIGRYIDILLSRGEDRGKTIYDDREINQISVTAPENSIYTAAFGYGASEDFDEDGETEQLDFSSIEWSTANGDPVDKPMGQKWVGLPDSYKEQYGLLVNGERKHRMTVYEDSDINITGELLRKTYDSLLANIEDNTEYSIKAVDMKALGFETEEMRLGDTIGVVINQINTKLKAKIIRYVENYLEPEKNDFELANYAQGFTSRMSAVESNLKMIKSISQATANKFLNNLLEQWNKEINALGGYVYSEDGKGISTYNAVKESATQVTQLLGGALRIANSKTSGEWDWRTAITGDGIIADAIYTGLLTGNSFELNLDSGTVKIGQRNEQGDIVPQISFDGSVLRFGLGSIQYDNLDQDSKDNLKGETGPQGEQGLQGIQGPKGDQGVKGDSGDDGLDSYTHIAYAANSTGSAGFSTSDPTGKTYIGIYVDHIATDSTNPSSYVWSLIQGPQGPEGNEGAPGLPGDDGETPYFHVAWATSDWGNTGFSTTESTNKTYIGVYTDYNQQDSQNPQVYSWSLIKGAQGEVGPTGPKGDTGDTGAQGLRGPQGEDGQTLYTWIKYADGPQGSGISDSPTGKMYIGLAYNKTTSTESTNVSDYSWSLIKGDTGAAGPAGSNGQSLYTWIKYADTPTSGMSDDLTGKLYIGLAYNKTVASESTNYSDYSWSEMPQNIEIGGTNLLLNSGEEITNSLYNIKSYTITQTPIVGEKYTITLKGYLGEGKTRFVAYNSGGSVSLVQDITSLGNDLYQSTFTWRNTSGSYTADDTQVYIYTYPSDVAVESTVEWIKLEKGNKATDWTPAPEDTQTQINGKADQSTIDDLNQDLSDLATTIPNSEAINELINSTNEYLEIIQQQEISINEAAETIQNLLDKASAIELNLSDLTQRWSFIDTYMVAGEEGLYIGEKDGSSAIRVTTNRIDFLDGSGEPVAYITNQVMRINRGIFVDSAQIGEHKIETISGGHTVFTWVAP